MRNERGIALVTALLLTLFALAIAGAVLYLITQSIQTSSASKKYKNALEASQGGVEVFTKDLITQIYTGTASSTELKNNFSGISLNFGSYSSCVKHKLNTSTALWNTTALCGANAKVIDPKNNFDATFVLKGLTPNSNFKAYAQIVDTVQGNSDKSGTDSLDSGSGVAGSGAGISPIHVPAVYTIEVQGEKETNPLEKARLSVLYAY